MMDIYTPINEASAEIKKRWNNEILKKEVSEYLGGDIPEPLISGGPYIVLFRNVATANLESERLLELSKQFGLEPLIFEYHRDKFVSFNPDKYDILMQKINLEKKNDGYDVLGKIKIADIDASQGKPFNDIKTVWGEDLIKFHHNIIDAKYPELKGKIFDLSDWLNRNGGKARSYYERFMTLLLRNCILAESFELKGDEERFIKEVIEPAFQKNEEGFGLRPLIVQLAPEGKELDPIWWYPKEEMRDLIKRYIIKYKDEQSV